MQRQGGYRKKSRQKLRVRARERGKVTISKIIKRFNLGDSVAFIQNASVQKGMPHPKWKGLVGRVVEKRGASYVVLVNVGDAQKKVISRPVHLKLLSEVKSHE